MPSILLITLEKIVTLCCFFLLCKSYLYSNFLTTSLNKHFLFTAIIPTCNLSFVTLRHNFCLQSILIHYKYEFIFTTSTQGQQTFILSWCKLLFPSLLLLHSLCYQQLYWDLWTSLGHWKSSIWHCWMYMFCSHQWFLWRYPIVNS